MKNSSVLEILNLGMKRRVPLVRQSEATECGLACLAMIAGYHGFETDIATLRRKFSVSLKGVTLKGLINIADKMMFLTRALRVDISHLGQVVLPAIIHWDMSHFVVLNSWSSGTAVVLDPALGRRTYTSQEFSKHFTGIVLEAQPAESFKRKSEKIIFHLRDMWSGMIGLRRNLTQIFVLAGIMQLFVLASPFYLQVTIDEILTKFDLDLLFVLAIGFAGFTVLNVIAQSLRGYVLLYLGSMLSFQMITNLFRHMVHLPLPFFEKRHVGDIISRFGSSEPIRKFLTEGIVAIVIDGTLAITTLILMYVYSPLLASIAVGAWLLYLIMRLALYSPFRRAQEDVIVSKGKEDSIFIETLRGMTAIKLFAAESDRQSQWQHRFADVISTSARMQRLQIWFGTGNAFLFGIEHVILIFVAAKMVVSAQFTIGMLFAFMAYRRSFSDKAIALVERAIEFRLLNLHLERIADIALEDQEKSDPLSQLENTPIAGALEFKNVSFSYATDEPLVLNGANFNIKAGESVAIVGPSGCGKTTLLKVATGLFKVNDGDVLIDEISLHDMGAQNLRQQIGVVMQEDTLFAGSLAENIAFFDPEIDMCAVIDCAKKAVIHNEIMAMPMKYESIVGDMGSALSGGQLQRVLLARALYRQPRILFMDEGTAHLDVATERAVIKSITSLGITRIIIAHRPETIKFADRVFSFERGNLIEINYPIIDEINNDATNIAGVAYDMSFEAAPLKSSKQPMVNLTIDGAETSLNNEGRGWQSSELGGAFATQSRRNYNSRKEKK